MSPSGNAHIAALSISAQITCSGWDPTTVHSVVLNYAYSLSDGRLLNGEPSVSGSRSLELPGLLVDIGREGFISPDGSYVGYVNACSGTTTATTTLKLSVMATYYTMDNVQHEAHVLDAESDPTSITC